MYDHYEKTLNTRTDALFYGRPRSLIALAYDGDTPIACILLHAYVIDTFVKTDYRRKGIGTKLFEGFVKHHKLEGKFMVAEGVQGSESFFNHVGVEMTSYDDYLKGIGKVIKSMEQKRPTEEKSKGWTASFRSFVGCKS